MKKLAKTIFVAVAVLLVAALVAPTLLRSKIETIVKSEANKMLVAKLDFESLNISLLRHFPNASLGLKGLTLVGVERFEGDTILAAERISVVVSPLSLLSSDGFKVKKVLLDAPSVYAHKLEDGAVNWDVMRTEEGEEVIAEEIAAEAAETTDEAAAPSAFKLAVQDFRIEEASLRYADDSTKMYFSTAPLDVRLQGDLSAAKSELELNILMQELFFKQGVVTMLTGAEVEFDARIKADLEKMNFGFAKNTLRLNAIQLTLDGWAQLMEDDAIAMDLTLGTSEVQFKDVLSLIPAFYTKDFRRLTAGGELSLSAWAKGEMRGSELPAFALEAAVKEGRFQYASLPKAVTDINIEASVKNPGGVMDQTEINLSKFGLKMAGNAVAATFYGTNLITDPLLRATLDGRIDLGAVEEVYPLEDMALEGTITADLAAACRISDLEQQRYEQLSAKGTFIVEKMGLDMASLPPVKLSRAAATISPQAMTLGELSLMVGESDLSANGRLSNYLGYLLRGDKLSGRLYLKSELLNLNQLMESMASDTTTEEPTEEPVAEVAEVSAEVAPTEAIVIPENLDLSLSTELKKILFQQMTITDVKGGVSLAGGALSLDGLQMGLFGGEAKASGKYLTTNPAAPTFTMDLALKQASFQETFTQLEMVQKLVPLFAKTGGNYSLSMDLSTLLDGSMSPVMNTVNAHGQLSSASIRLQNIEALDALANALKYDKLKVIEAENVLIDFTVKDGRVNTEPFDLKMGKTVMTLSGSTGLDQTIDYTAEVALPEGTANGLLSKFNVGIGGTFSKPEIKVGVKEAAKEAVTSVLDQQVQKLTGSESLAAEIEKQAENLRAEAVRAGEKLVAAAQEQSAKLVEQAASKGKLAQVAAKAAGDKLVKEAEKQAENLKNKAEEQIAKLGTAK
ncbi:MAG: AsmA-like C-terminal region-containing protein [Rikenellaceae bacterium]|nr:AsmA-like C-terminal region-containing protein [Rikenellaceae bacterium]